jgi:putative transposase
MRHLHFENYSYYHVFNRGIDKRKIFLRHGHYVRFTNSILNLLDTGSATYRRIYNQGSALKQKVKILCYCLMPNHYHLLIQQLSDNGITEFMHHLDTSYTMYFNINNKRKGRLFEYEFKAKLIESDEVLNHISRYIHLNPLIAKLTDDFASYEWSSYPEYLNQRKNLFCDTTQVLSFHAFNPENYRQFVNDQISYSLLLKEIEVNAGDEDTLFI